MANEKPGGPEPALYCAWARFGTRGQWRLIVRAADSRDVALARARSITLGRPASELCVLRAGERPEGRA